MGSHPLPQPQHQKRPLPDRLRVDSEACLQRLVSEYGSLFFQVDAVVTSREKIMAWFQMVEHRNFSLKRSSKAHIANRNRDDTVELKRRFYDIKFVHLLTHIPYAAILDPTFLNHEFMSLPRAVSFQLTLFDVIRATATSSSPSLGATLPDLPIAFPFRPLFVSLPNLSIATDSILIRENDVSCSTS
jgi:hypothetical protein